MEHARAGGKPAIAGAFVALDPLNGEVLAMGSSPSFDPNRFAKPLTEAEYDELTGRNGEEPGRLTESRRRRRIPDRLHVQADHRDGGAGSGCDHPQRGSRRRAVHLRLERAVLQRRACGLRSGDARGSAEGVIGHLLLHRRRARQRTRRRNHPEEGPRAGGGGADGIDLPSEFPGVVPDPKWLAEQNALRSQMHAARTTATRATSSPNRGRRGRSATTWTWRSGRASC